MGGKLRIAICLVACLGWLAPCQGWLGAATALAASMKHSAHGHHQQSMTPVPEHAVSKKDLEQKWGIRLVALRLSAAGHMLDLRYKVTNFEKAKSITAYGVRTFAIDPKRNLVLTVPSPRKVGQLRPRIRSSRPGVIYYALFGNPNRVVKPGDKLTLVMGKLRIDNVKVEG